MKILIAAHGYPSSVSRLAGSFVHNQVRFLQAHCAIRCVSPTPWFPLPGFGRWSAYGGTSRREVMDGIDVARPRYVTLPRRVLLAHVWRSYLRALIRAAGEGGEDVIHAHYAYPDGLAAVHYARRRGGIPVVITVHGHDIKDLAAGREDWRRVVTQALEGATTVIAVSEELAQLVRQLGIAPDKVHVIHNGVDGEVFKPTGSKTGREGKRRLLYVGRFDVAKGLKVLLAAAARLRAGGRDLQLTFVGGGAAGTAEPFQREAHRLGVADIADFIDEVPWSEMPAVMSAADLLVLPSFSEGLPLVLVEAMACGLPLVATRCGGPIEVVEEMVGRLVEVGDEVDLERGIAHVLDHYDSYDRDAIRRRALERFDYRRIVERIHSVYENAMS